MDMSCAALADRESQMDLFLHGNGAAATIYFGVGILVPSRPDHHSDDLKGSYSEPFRTYGLCMSDHRQVNSNCRIEFCNAWYMNDGSFEIFCYSKPLNMRMR